MTICQRQTENYVAIANGNWSIHSELTVQTNQCRLLSDLLFYQPFAAMESPYSGIVYLTWRLQFTLRSTPLYWISVICTSRFDYRRSHRNEAYSAKRKWFQYFMIGKSERGRMEAPASPKECRLISSPVCITVIQWRAQLDGAKIFQNHLACLHHTNHYLIKIAACNSHLMDF